MYNITNWYLFWPTLTYMYLLIKQFDSLEVSLGAEMRVQILM